MIIAFSCLEAGFHFFRYLFCMPPVHVAFWLMPSQLLNFESELVNFDMSVVCSIYYFTGIYKICILLHGFLMVVHDASANFRVSGELDALRSHTGLHWDECHSHSWAISGALLSELGCPFMHIEHEREGPTRTYHTQYVIWDVIDICVLVMHVEKRGAQICAFKFKTLRTFVSHLAARTSAFFFFFFLWSRWTY